MKVYIDRDLGRSFGEALRLLGVEVLLYLERYHDVAPPHDDVWIPDIAADDYVILTHDGKIRSRSGERQVFQASNAKCFVLATRNATRLENFRAIMIAWDEIRRIVASEQAPFMYGISKTGKLTKYI